MSCVDTSLIHAIAASVGLDNVSDDLARAVAADVEFRLRELVQEASSFMRHSKRDRLTHEDINHALRLRNVEVLYGHSSEEGGREYLTLEQVVKRAVEDDNDDDEGVVASGGRGGKKKPKLTKGQKARAKAKAKATEQVKAAAIPGEVLYVPNDKVLSFAEIINAPLPKAPLEPSFSAHWLAVEGVQPAVPANPAPLTLAQLQVAEGVQPDVVGVSEEQISALGTGAAAGKAALGGEGGAAAGLGGDKATVRPFVRHVLSQELQMYYKMATNAVVGDDEEFKSAVLTSLTSDPGLHQLVPYFVHFVAHTVATSLRNLPVLTSLMRMAKALFESEHMHIAPYLHQLMPPILTCIVARRLCASPAENHWELRLFAARLLRYVCSIYGTAYVSLQPRIIKTLVRAFMDPLRPITTHYGAVAGLTALGPRVVQFTVLPNVPTYMKWLGSALEDADPVRSAEADRMRTLLVTAVKRVLEANELAVVDAKVVPAPNPASGPATDADIIGINALAKQLSQLIPDINVDFQVVVDAIGSDHPRWAL